MKRHVFAFAATMALVGIQGNSRADLLGAAESFAVLGGSTVTNTGPSNIFGDLGVSPGTAVTGFGPGVVTGGLIHLNDAIAIQAQADAAAAYTLLSKMPNAIDLTGQDLGGLILTPGVYNFSSAAEMTGILTLDGNGQVDPMFVFQIGSTLTTASSASMVLKNGAQADNIYFQVGSSATLGTNTSFAGTIISFASDTLTTGVNVNGRVIALTGAVTLDTNIISLPQAVPEPASFGLLGVGMLALFARRRLRRTAA